MIKNANSYSSMVQRINNIQLSKSDRQLAEEHMRDAELVAELICRACENLRSAEALLSRVFAHRT
ncbi:MAG TPA: hypothetical protein VEF92_07195 [Burkholderiales bacterium]|nr:hypothetical protein [Burkholderiales bacterium]